MKSNSQETFNSQIKELWKSCSKRWLGIAILASIIIAFIVNVLKLYFQADNSSFQFGNSLIWDSDTTQFFLLAFCLWIVILNKRIFFSKNISDRFSKFKLTFDRIISQGHSIQFYWLVCFFALLFVFLSALMGTFNAFGVFPNDNNLNWNPLSLTYLLLTDSSTIGSILKTNTHVASLIVTICIIISVLGTLLFTGLLVSVFSNFLQRRVEDFKNGKLCYDLSDHIVFIGYDEILPMLVKQCAEYNVNKGRKIVVQTKLSSEQVRDDVKTLVADENLFRNIIFYNGKRDSVRDLRNLNLDKAFEVFVIGNRQNDNHDELNLQCLNYIREIIGGRNDRKDFEKKVLTHVLIEDHTEYSKMKFLWDDEVNIVVSLFNIYAIWAKALIHAKFDYPKLEILNENSDKGINIVIFGSSKFGHSIGLESINTYKHKRENKTIITYICEDALFEMDMLRARFSELFKNVKCSYNNFVDPPIVYDIKDKEGERRPDWEIEFLDTNPYNTKMYSHIEKRALQKYMFLCYEKNTMNLNVALFMPQRIKKESIIYILQKHGTEFVNKLNSYERFQTFGKLLPSYDFYKYLLENPYDLYDKYDSFIEISNIYENQGNWNEAIGNFSVAYNIGVELFGKENLITANNLIQMGFLYARMDDYETASGYYYKALALKEKLCGEKSLEVAYLYIIIGWNYIYMSETIGGDFNYWAEELFGKALEIVENKIGYYCLEVAEIYYALFYARESQGNNGNEYLTISNEIREKINHDLNSNKIGSKK